MWQWGGMTVLQTEVLLVNGLPCQSMAFWGEGCDSLAISHGFK